MTTLKKIFLYAVLVVGCFISTFLILTTNFFEFNYPMSLALLPLPFMATLFLGFYWKKKNWF